MKLRNRFWMVHFSFIRGSDWDCSSRCMKVVLAHELRKKGLIVERQKPMPIVYDGVRFNKAFRSDLVVNAKVIAELKSVETTSALYAKQLLTQLRLSGLKLGLLINFGEAHLKNGIKRIINGKLDDESASEVSL